MIAVSSACVASLAFVIVAPTVLNWNQLRNSGVLTGAEVFDGSPAGPQLRAPVQEREVANERGVTRGLQPDSPPASPAVPRSFEPRILEFPSAAGDEGRRRDTSADGSDGPKSATSVQKQPGDASPPLPPTPSVPLATGREPSATNPVAPPRVTLDSTPTAESYVVQVSLERKESDAQASVRNLRVRFSKVLGDRKATVRRADLGPSGVYYRTLVGPFVSAGDADRFCSRLRAAGGQCIIQKD
jgi:cell division septation protein DedD